MKLKNVIISCLSFLMVLMGCLKKKKDVFWKYAIIILSLVIVIWGVYVGIKIITASRNDEKVNAKGMLKNLLIGVLVIFNNFNHFCRVLIDCVYPPHFLFFI